MAIRAGALTGLMNQPTAQVVDGSLKFDGGSNLQFRPGSAGDTKTWTWSGWVKRTEFSTLQGIFSARDGATGLTLQFGEYNTTEDYLVVYNSVVSGNYVVKTSNQLRDTGWYHIVLLFDTTQNTNTNRLKIYINGTEAEYGTDNRSNLTRNSAARVNEAMNLHYVGSTVATDEYTHAMFSNVYFIDGYALSPEQFGFTDPLTNTWKPKAYNINLHTKINDGTVWSDSWDGTGSTGTVDNPARAFNGDLNNYTSNQNSNTICNWVPATPITIKRSLRIYASAISSGNNQVFVNGTTIGTVSGTAQWYNIQATELTSIGLQDIGSTHGYLHAVEVDGVILVDSSTSNDADSRYPWGRNGWHLPLDGNSPIGEDSSKRGNDWTPVNFGGSVALDNPQVSGAKPILNTTQGGTQAGFGVFGSKENIVYTVTVSNPGSGNKYYLDGVEAPTLSNLVRGATYTFDQSDSSNSSHPLVFGSTAEGNNFARGALYGSISAGTAGAATTITIPYDAPETLYYHCSAHSGMGGSIVGIHTDETKADQYASNCVLALPLVGSKDDVSASIACTSTTKTTAVSGNAASNSTSSNFYGNSFYFDGTDDYHDSTITALASRDFTIEFWFMSTATDGYQTLFEYGDHTSNGVYITLRDGDAIAARSYNGQDISNATISSPSHNTPKDKWHHIAITRESNTAKLFINGKYIGNKTWSTSYTPTKVRLGHSIYSAGSAEDLTGYIQDVRIYDGVVKYTGTTIDEQSFVVSSPSPDILPDTPSGVSGSSKLAKITDGAVSFEGTATSKLKIGDSTDFTFSTNDFAIEFYYYNKAFDGTYDIIFDCMGSNRSGIQLAIETDNDYRIEVGDGSNNWIWQSTGFDSKPRQWTHFALTREGNTFRAFENGVLLGTQTSSTAVGDPRSPAIGGYASDDSTNYGFNGFISNFRIVNGSAVYTTSFTPPTAPLTNVTNTKLLCCQSNTSATEAAVTPGSITATGDAAATNFNPFNTDINTVRGQETGYATLNPLNKGSLINLSNGNLGAQVTSQLNEWGIDRKVFANIGVSSGKWYAEMHLQESSSVYMGIIGNIYNIASATSLGYQSQGWGYYTGGNIFWQGGTYQAAPTFTVGDTIATALDVDNLTVSFYKNGMFVGSRPITSGLEWFYAQDSYTATTTTWNFGQKPFKFPPPDGFQPLNIANTRPETVITRPDKYVGITTWTGNATSGRLITGLNFNAKPDLIWIKNRGEDVDHTLFDSVRGFGANEELTPNDQYTEGETGVGKPNTNAWGYVNSNNFNGFTVNNGSSGQSLVNNNNINYVAWCWKAGDTTVTNNDGTIATQVRANTEAGFSIVTASVNQASGSLGHGLGKTPDMILSKSRTVAYDWNVMNRELGGSEIMRLNTDAAKQTSSNYFNSFNSSTFSVAGGNSANCSGDMVYYCWTNIPGLQKFGSFEGNANTNGPFVELGFRPAVLILKNADATGNWFTYDATRNPNNPSKKYLRPNLTSIEYTISDGIDFLSNGFKVRQSSASHNGSGNTIIYAAWAEAPSIDLFGGGANAR